MLGPFISKARCEVERILTLERLLKKMSELFGHADFIAVELMLARVRITMAGSVISEESYEGLRPFFGAGLAQFPEEMPFRSFATERRDAGFRAMTAWLDSFWHRATSNDFGDIFIFCDVCYEKRPDKELFFWWLADETCDACGLCTHEDRCLHCGEMTSSYMRFAVPHFEGKIGYGVEWSKFLGMRDIAVCMKCAKWWPTMVIGDQVEFRESGTTHYPPLDPEKPRPASFLEIAAAVPGIEVTRLQLDIDALKNKKVCAKCKREIGKGEIYARDGEAVEHRGDCPPVGEAGPPADGQ